MFVPPEEEKYIPIEDMEPEDFRKYIIANYGKFPQNYEFNKAENLEFYNLGVQRDRLFEIASTIPKGDPRRKELNDELKPIVRRRAQILRNRILKTAKANWARAQARESKK